MGVTGSILTQECCQGGKHRVDLTMGIISHVSQDNMTTVTDPTQLSWELCQAVMANDQALVEKLQAAGHKLTGTYSGGNTIIHWALGVRSKCDTDLLEYLWRCGAPMGEENHSGATPLRIAIRNGKQGLANALLAMGERLPQFGDL